MTMPATRTPLLLLAVSTFVLLGCEPDATVEPAIQPTAADFQAEEEHLKRDAQRRALSGVTLAYEAVILNMANAEQPGYQAIRPRFKDGDPMPELHRDTRRALPIETGRWLDAAITGDGYFVIDAPAGVPADEAYTRMGHFYISDTNDLVVGSPDGPRVRPRIVFPDEYRSIYLCPDGAVEVVMPGQTRAAKIGQLQIARFANDQGLKSSREGIFHTGPESGIAIYGHPNTDAFGKLLQHHLEGSNVDVVAELLELRRLKDYGQSLGQSLGIATIFDADPPVSAQSVLRPSSAGVMVYQGR